MWKWGEKIFIFALAIIIDNYAGKNHPTEETILVYETDLTINVKVLGYGVVWVRC